MMHPYIKYPNAKASQAPWAVPALCAAYGWPTGLAGGGKIGIIELDGGYTQSDIKLFFDSIGQPIPNIVDISVDGSKNAPGLSDADGEVALDIQVAAAAYFVATGKPATIRVYWANNSSGESIAHAVTRAGTDGCDVCSISWGADEAAWGPTLSANMEAAALAATRILLLAHYPSDNFCRRRRQRFIGRWPRPR